MSLVCSGRLPPDVTAGVVPASGPGTQSEGNGGGGGAHLLQPNRLAWSRPVFSGRGGGGVTSAFTGQLGQVLGTSLS